MFENEDDLIERLKIPFKEELVNADFSPSSLLLQWHITNQCNLRCKHCYQEGYSDGQDLPFLQLQNILEQYVNMLKKRSIRGQINITGGEPLINPDLFSLLEKINLHKSYLGFAILSNGVNIDQSTARKLKALNCSFFQISVEGGKDIHDAIRGEGNYEKCIRALEVLQKNKIKTMVSFTLSRFNQDNFDEVVKFCRKNKVDILWSDRYIPMGNGKEMKDSFMDPFEVEQFFNKMYRWHHKLNSSWFGKTELRMHRALNFLVTEKNNCDCYAPYKCNAGKSLITILPNGDLVPCRRMPVVVGNVLHTPLESLYQNSRFFKLLRNSKKPYQGCESCADWKKCNGGLRCLSYARYGNPFMVDPQCFKNHSTLPLIKQ